MSPSALLALTALAALAAAAHALPAALDHQIHPRTVDLAQALNHTVCPIKVHVDIDDNRTPRRIKMLQCAPNPNQWCRRQNIPPHECCHHTHDNHQMECVQMQDTVLVQYKDGHTGSFEVAVGCSCMVNQSSPATTVSQEPS